MKTGRSKNLRIGRLKNLRIGRPKKSYDREANNFKDR